MQEIITKLLGECRQFTSQGTVANYIPELAKAETTDLGVYIIDKDGGDYFAGEYDKTFTIQSICKTIFLSLAAMDHGIEFIKNHVGVEATGKPFNAIDYAEPLLLKEHINPMVNIGAIAVCGMVKAENNKKRFEKLLDFTRRLTRNPDLIIDQDVYKSEKETGNKNRALAYLLKNSEMIEGDVEDLLDVYFAMCSIKINCKDLANMGFVLANHGKDRVTGEQIIPKEDAMFMNAVLTTCGMYDGSGEFAIKVGIPAKSGVGGGIMAVVPGKMGIGIFSPGLDEKGNSLAGIKLLERLSLEFELSMF